MRGSTIKESSFIEKLFLTSLIMMIFMMDNNVQVAYGDLSPSQCKQQRKSLENSCKPVIFGFKASADCCAKVRAANVECVCPSITPKFVALIGAERFIRTIEGCGRPVPHNFKCGNTILDHLRHFQGSNMQPCHYLGPNCRYYHSMKDARI